MAIGCFAGLGCGAGRLGARLRGGAAKPDSHLASLAKGRSDPVVYPTSGNQRRYDHRAERFPHRGLGDRQHHGDLRLELECSLGSDFGIALDEKAEITSLTLDGRTLPVPREGAKLIVSVHPRQADGRSRLANRGNARHRDQSRAGRAAGRSGQYHYGDDRARQPLGVMGRGTAARPGGTLWAILAVAVIAALVLGSIRSRRCATVEWVLLAIGLTQVNVVAAMIVVLWLFLLAWRGKKDPALMQAELFNGVQFALVLLTLVSLVILVGGRQQRTAGPPRDVRDGRRLDAELAAVVSPAPE